MTNDSRLYIFAGGGSGGHLYPGIAVAQAMRQIDPGAEVLFLCTKRQIDSDILSDCSWQYLPQPVEALPNPKRFGQVWQFWRSWRQSIRMCTELIREKQPAAVLGLGGFASGPAMKVAAKMKLPTAMLNPDALPGKANKYCRKFADKIFLQWQITCQYFNEKKSIVTGCPIRQEFFEAQLSKEAAKEQLGLDAAKQTLVVMGGSLGGHNVNKAVVKCLAGKDAGLNSILRNWQIVHITGKDDWQWVQGEYNKASINAKVQPFSTQMNIILTAADLAISRAGASSLAELTAVGRGSILLPYPYHRDQHQLRNAEVLTDAAAAKIVTDDCDTQSTARRLADVLHECITGDNLDQMAKAAESIGKPDAAILIAKELNMITTAHK